ncbi:SpoVR family protein [Botrimarina sp.]|uniref:SpoVR family protein n=1 Tax=Botrimarina sp. TaxID=2795802 RepID=UPI0032ED4A73
MPLNELAPLPPDLAAIQAEIEGIARSYGLDFFPTIFELVDADRLNEIAAKGGFPTRYPHWRFGMEYDKLSKQYHYGLGKIYELVINNDPCYAYLMRSNMAVDQRLVMAHVYGHCDFFKQNAWFAKTSRKMMDETANHGSRIRRYMDEFGVEPVEEFIDACLSLDDLIDIHSPHIRRREDCSRYDFDADAPKKRKNPAQRFAAKGYMDAFINPRGAAEERPDEEEAAPKNPERPERDVLLFLLEQAPLAAWQHDVLAILREEAYYFAPQGQTKIMNEGWASYWHSTIMTRHGLTPSDFICYCDHHSGTMASAPDRLNPYKLGIELFRDIEDRWNRGAHGRAYDDCDDARERREWDTKEGAGREKIFEVRKVHNDLTFIDTFLTLDFVREQRLFKFGWNESAEQYEIESRAFPKVKQQLLASLTNAGRPIIEVVDGNYKNRAELYLEHRFAGAELDLREAQDTLRALHRLWKRPVRLATVLEESRAVVSYDGKKCEIQHGDPADAAPIEDLISNE